MTIEEVAERVAAQTGRLYMVGGAVRDLVMGRGATDLDYCVIGLTRDDFVQLFPDAIVTGQDFPVFRMSVDGTVSEFALARTERKTAPGHGGFAVHYDPSVTIEEDLLRRDLTVNAIAMDVLTGELVDPFHGQSDIRSGTIRAVSEAFAEDPLRVYRAARFAATLEFRIDSSTIERMTALGPELSTLSAERVFEELKKALGAPRPSVFFRSLVHAGILSFHFPELSALIGVGQPIQYHPEGDAFEHTMQVVDAAAALSPREDIRFSALVHDVGKGVTPKEKWPSHPGHEARGVPLVESLCTRLKVPVNWTRASVFATGQHMKIHNLHLMKPRKVVELLSEADRNPLGVQGFSVIGMADIRGRNNPDAPNWNAEQMVPLWNTISQTVTGKTLKTEAVGKQFGEKLMEERAKVVQAWRNNQSEYK